jgi:hypothetical protein
MSDPELTPDQEERVRRLLAEARHRDPMPPDVVARLDRVLADLADESAATSEPAPSGVVLLESRRRRRRFGTILVAAAAVTVVGVGLSEFTDGVGSMNATSDSGADSAGMAEEGTGEQESAPEANEDGGELAGSSPPADESQRDASEASKYARRMANQAQEVGTESFRRDARRLAAFTPVAAGKADALLKACGGAADWGAGDVVPATYSGQLGALVYRTPTSDGQQVELFLCGVDGPVRSVTLPAPDVAP